MKRANTQFAPIAAFDFSRCSDIEMEPAGRTDVGQGRDLGEKLEGNKKNRMHHRLNSERPLAQREEVLVLHTPILPANTHTGFLQEPSHHISSRKSSFSSPPSGPGPAMYEQDKISFLDLTEIWECDLQQACRCLGGL
jgi:hypothetical protein